MIVSCLIYLDQDWWASKLCYISSNDFSQSLKRARISANCWINLVKIEMARISPHGIHGFITIKREIVRKTWNVDHVGQKSSAPKESTWHAPIRNAKGMIVWSCP